MAGIIPLLAVVQPTKNKVRPVMDYRELNDFVECHTGDDMVAVCGTFGTKNVGTSDGAAFAAVGATKRGVGNSVVPLRIEDPA